MSHPITTLTIGAEHLKLYCSTTPRQWRQGLVGASLAGIDGMVFVFGGDVQYQFQMDGMATPVVLALFTAAGDLVDLTYLAVDAVPYSPSRPYRYALELVGRHATPDGVLGLLPGFVDGAIDMPA